MALGSFAALKLSNIVDWELAAGRSSRARVAIEDSPFLGEHPLCVSGFRYAGNVLLATVNPSTSFGGMPIERKRELALPFLLIVRHPTDNPSQTLATERSA